MSWAVVQTGVVARQAGAHLACDPVSKWLLLGGSFGLAAFDIRVPLEPRKTAFCKITVTSHGAVCYVLISGDIAYVVGGYGLAVISLTELRSEPRSRRPWKRLADARLAYARLRATSRACFKATCCLSLVATALL